MEQFLPGLTFAPNLHPLVVHFPIAFWVAATLAWFFALLRRKDDAWRFGLWLHTLGLVGAAVAIALGYWAAENLGHDSPGHELVHVHRDFMLVASGLAVLLTGAAWWKRDAGRGWRLGFSLASAAVLTVMTLGADRGAELVYRYGVGVSRETPAESGHGHGGGDDHDAPHPATSAPHAAGVAHPPEVSSTGTAPSPIPSASASAAPKPANPTEKSAPVPTKVRPKGHGDHTH